MPKLKRYYTLLEQLRDQEKCINEFEQRLLHIESTLVEHQNNAEHPILKFTSYDPLRNSIARSRRLAEVMFNLHFFYPFKHFFFTLVQFL